MERDAAVRVVLARLVTFLLAAGVAMALPVALAGAQDEVDLQATYDETESSFQRDQDPAPGTVPPVGTPDTDLTPRHGADKDASETWKQVEGSLFRDADNPAKAETTVGDVTTYRDNLYDVAFRGDLQGLAVGESCEDPDPDALRTKTPAEIGCRPAVFEYRESELGAGWRRAALPGGERAGFAAAVAWINTDRALVVGGTGVYPRREPSYRPSCQDPADALAPWNVKCDPAGKARAWLYDLRKPEAERWCEVAVGGEGDECAALPDNDSATPHDDSPRALTAVGFKPDPEREIGFAAGLGQIFRWRGDGTSGGFDRRYDAHSRINDLSEGSDINPAPPRSFRFRVRALRAAPSGPIRVYAVTSGCCTPDDKTDQAQMATYTERTGGGPAIPGKWFLRSAASPLPGELPKEDGRPHQSGAGAPDSVYALTTTKAANALSPEVSVVATTASWDSALETRSQVRRCVGPGHTGGAPTKGAQRDVVTPLSGAARLLAADGTTPSGSLDSAFPYNRPFLTSTCAAGPEWAVGELRTRRVAGRGRRGLVLLAETATRRRPEAVRAPGTSGTNLTETPNSDRAGQEVLSGDYRPTDDERRSAALTARDQLVSSYTLNGIDMIAELGNELVNESGKGWAVGDHGAILRLDPGAADRAIAAAEPLPPSLDHGRERRLADSSAFDPLRPAPAKPGQVPALATRPLQQLTEPVTISGGSPDATHDPQTTSGTENVGEIVMSRDGSEGWAVGTSPVLDQNINNTAVNTHGTLSLFHYAGGTWTRCDALGIRDQLPADRACASLARLKGYLAPFTDQPTTVTLVGAARVPHERGGTPDDDDEFEVVAIGTGYHRPGYAGRTPVALRYRDGEWKIDEGLWAVTREVQAAHSSGSVELRAVAFAAPDDGWVLASTKDGPTSNPTSWLLLHWDGSGWRWCGGTGPPCPPRVPRDTVAGAVLGLEAAGDRVYLHGWRRIGADLKVRTGIALVDNAAGVVPNPSFAGNQGHPLIIYHDRRAQGWHADDGGYDPGFNPDGTSPPPRELGKVVSLSVAERPGGGYAGWAVGRFYRYDVPPDISTSNDSGNGGQHNAGGQATLEPTALLLRLTREDGGDRWRHFNDRGALYDLMNPAVLATAYNMRGLTKPSLQASWFDSDGSERAVIAQRRNHNLFGFAESRGRFETLPAGRPPALVPGAAAHGMYQAVAPDGRGGAWLAVNSVGGDSGATGLPAGKVFFLHHTSSPPEPVLEEVAHPLGDGADRLTALAGAADGTVWGATDQGRLARYDRMLGWETLTIPGWDPGRVVTRRSEIFGIGLNADGVGVAVGRGGRIANLTPAAVALDRAAGSRCGAQPEPPCGTGYDLHAAAVDPAGSTLVAGVALTVLWRPPGDRFRRVARPPGNAGNRITGAAHPVSGEAWLTSDAGFVYHGVRSGESWSWEVENRDAKRRAIGGEPLQAIAIDADGHGYAVGAKGTVLERVPGADPVWRRMRGPGTDDLTAVTLSTDGRGALVGGRNGVVWTRNGDRFEVARPADYSRGGGEGGALGAGGQTFFDSRGLVGPTTGPVVGLALLPGVEDGQVEAWAGVRALGEGTNVLLHHASDPDEPLLDPSTRTQPLPDAPEPRPGEIAFAALGNSDCDLRTFCKLRRNTLARFEVIGDRIVGDLRARAAKPGAPGFTLFTGDATFTAGILAASVHRSDRVGTPGQWNLATGTPSTDVYGWEENAMAPVNQRQWVRMVAERLDRAGAPLFAAPGAGDLSRPAYRGDATGQGAWAEEAKTGDNLSWREAMEARPAPWGRGGTARSIAAPLEFTPAPRADAGAARVDEVEAGGAVSSPRVEADPDGDGPVPKASFKAGARTHYAVDVKRGGEPVARIVVVDSSLRSLSASDPIQEPFEPTGQLAWLERMACVKGGETAGAGACTRERDQSLIVLTNTPTYSYRGDTAESNVSDGIRLEEVLMRHRASVVVSGRHNANLRYWATAPGVHEPCPGGSYQDTPPPPGARVCGRGTDDPGAAVATRHVGAVLRGLGAPAAPDEAVGEAAGGILPFVVAATAGGPFGTSALGGGQREAGDGYWSGYTIVRVPADGDPTGVVVEQRPVFDWISLTGATHTLRPGQRLVLRGVGREPIGFGASVFTRFDPIDSPAITHRYDLVEADPAKPWLPKLVEGNGNPHGYVPLDPGVGTVDPQTGRVIAGRGTRGRVHAIALLSVGAESASWPLVFEPRRSFTPPAPRRLTIPPPLPPIRVLGIPAQAVPSQPPPAPPATPPIAVDLALPPPPAVPGLPGSTPTPIAPPIPPVTPPPPASVGQTASGLAANPLAILLAPTAAPIPPSSPLIQPAPPSGARREARQKQAATAKSEEGGVSEAGENGGDLANAPESSNSSRMTRRDRIKAAPVGFTPRLRSSQPSAWVTGLQYGGGTALMALVLALGWTTGRPTPRQRPGDEVRPAPAFARRRRG